MHKPVLLNESIEFLNLRENLIYVDCTLGTGGHSFEILKRLNGTGKLIGIEQDQSILNIAKENLSQFKNCYLFHSNFTELADILSSLKINQISGGILLDLGVNSLHFDDPERGFSLKSEGYLDMRMDKSQELTAYKLINSFKEYELADVFYKYGEERYSKQIAKLIAEHKERKGPLKTTTELSNIILRYYRYRTGKSHFKIHPATKVFQALRIKVNNELENFEKFLCFIPELLLPTSRLTVISFHSLEDRITKKIFKSNKNFKILTKKPLTPTLDELKDNSRARSAKLRAAERI